MKRRNQRVVSLFWGAISLGILSILFEVGGLEPTYWGSLTKALFALVVSILIVLSTRRILPEHHSIWAFNVIYIIQLGAVFIALLTTPQAGFANMMADLRLTEELNGILYGLILIQLVPLGFAAVIRIGVAAKGGAEPVQALGERIRNAPPKLAFFFVLLALILLVRPMAIGNFFGGTTSYFLRVLAGMFILAPFFVHFLAHRYKHIKLLWGAVVVILAVSGMFTGGRFMAFSPLVLYALGFIAALPSGRKKRIMVLFAIISSIPFMGFLNLLGEIRDVHGRAPVTEIDSERIGTYLDSIRSDDFSTGTQDEPSRAPVSRLINWPNCFVLTYAPDTVSYRGTDNLDRELKSVFDIGLLSGRGRVERFEEMLGTAPARRFGFRVDEGTSVEYGVLADAWARGGPKIVVLYGVLLLLVVFAIERVLYQWAWKRYPAESLLVLIVMMNLLILSAGANPLYSVLRLLVLNILFLAVLLVMMNIIYRLAVRQGAWNRR